MSQIQDFSSLPPDQERQFVVFEQRSVNSAKRAMTLGAIVGGVFGLLVVIIVLSFDAPHNQHAQDMMEAESGEPRRAAPAVAPSAADVPAEPAEAEAAEEPEAGAEPAVEPPPPAPGTTKAPPTALIGK